MRSKLILSLLQANIISEELDDLIIAGDPGEGSLGVSIQQLGHAQICGDDGGLATQDPFVDAEEELGGGETVGQLGSQIIDDQQIAVKYILMGFHRVRVPVKDITAQDIEHLKGCKVDDGTALREQFCGNTVREEGLAHSGVTIEE